MDLTKLSGVVPQRILTMLPSTISRFNISNAYRLAHFLGQADEETGNFARDIENLNYSGDALWRIFHIHFKNQAEANSYAHQPERIANRIYANRMGNGPESSGDGWKYRGRGDMQLTGKVNYIAFGKAVGADLVNNPDLVATTYELDSAAYFFQANNLWAICDKGITPDVIKEITHHVNGGYLNLDIRTAYTNKIYNAIQ